MSSPRKAGHARCPSPVRPRASGDPVLPPASLALGPPLSRGRTEENRAIQDRACVAAVFNCQSAHTRSAPVLVRARGFARSPFPFPSPNEGSGAPRRRMVWISPDRPVFHGRARNAGSLAHMTRAPASSRRATRHLRSDRPAVLVPREGSPPPPGEAAYVEPPSQVPHPAPPSRHLVTMPLGRRE